MNRKITLSYAVVVIFTVGMGVSTYNQGCNFVNYQRTNDYSSYSFYDYNKTNANSNLYISNDLASAAGTIILSYL